MNETRYIAPLRESTGNIIRMSDLKASFEELGFSDSYLHPERERAVNTLEKDKQLLIEKIEQHLSERRYTSRRSSFSHKSSVACCGLGPRGFGDHPDEYRYNAVLKEPLTADEALQSIRTREGADYAGPATGCSTQC